MHGFDITNIYTWLIEMTLWEKLFNLDLNFTFKTRGSLKSSHLPTFH